MPRGYANCGRRAAVFMGSCPQSQEQASAQVRTSPSQLMKLLPDWQWPLGLQQLMVPHRQPRVAWHRLGQGVSTPSQVTPPMNEFTVQDEFPLQVIMLPSWQSNVAEQVRGSQGNGSAGAGMAIPEIGGCPCLGESVARKLWLARRNTKLTRTNTLCMKQA